MKALIAIILLNFMVAADVTAAENVVLITIDGVRWQEFFRGLDRDWQSTPITLHAVRS